MTIIEHRESVLKAKGNLFILVSLPVPEWIAGAQWVFASWKQSENAKPEPESCTCEDHKSN